MAFPFQVSEVVRPLRIDAAHALTLSLKLQRRAPKSMSAAARRELAQLEAATSRLNDDVASEVAGEVATIDQRPIARTAIVAWGTLHTRLESITRLDAATVPEANEAGAILAAIFAEGVSFTRSDFDTLWLRGQHTLDALKKGGHMESLTRLAGEFVVRAVQSAHHALGVVLGLTGSLRASPIAERDETPVDRRALLDAVTDAIARYAHQITAVDANDPAAVAAAARALEPIVKFRAKARSARRIDEGDDDEEPVTPVNEAKPIVPVNTPAANDADDAKRHVA